MNKEKDNLLPSLFPTEFAKTAAEVPARDPINESSRPPATGTVIRFRYSLQYPLGGLDPCIVVSQE